MKSVLAGRGGNERKILEGVFAPLDAEWKWLSVKISEVAPNLGAAPDALRFLISELEAGGEVVLKKSGWRQGFEVKKEVLDLKAASEDMAARFKEREARDLGLVLEVVPDRELMDRVREYALELAAKPPIALSLIKTGMNRCLASSFEEGLELESEAQAACLGSADFREAFVAWKQKRTGNYRGE